MIHQHNDTVALPVPIDDEFLLDDATGTQPTGLPSILEDFIASIEIFEVIEGAQTLILFCSRMAFVYLSSPQFSKSTKESTRLKESSASFAVQL